MKQPNKNPIKQANPRLYNIWCRMKDRCNNSNYVEFEYYGGRGIDVCIEWNASFNSFAEWSLSNGYAKNLSIDRKQNAIGYSPNNCRWADKFQQANNKRNNRFISIGEKTMTLSQWANEIGVSRKTLQSQLTRNGEDGVRNKVAAMAVKFLRDIV